MKVVQRDTLIYIGLIFLGSATLRPVFDFLQRNVGLSFIRESFWAVLIVAVACAPLLIRRFLSIEVTIVPSRYFWMTAALGILIAAQLEISEERFHLLEFGLLGIVLSRDSSRIESLQKWQQISLAIAAGTLVGVLDEGWQGILPNRVCDGRDILLNLVGVLWGSGLWHGLRISPLVAKKSGET